MLPTVLWFWDSGPRGFNDPEEDTTLPYTQLKKPLADEVTGCRAKERSVPRKITSMGFICDVK